MKRFLRATVRGNVQGVFFRDFAKTEAEKLGVCGWVANRPDGSVDIEAEGEIEALTVLVTLLRRGPPRSRVDDVDFEWGDFAGRFSRFEVRY